MAQIQQSQLVEDATSSLENGDIVGDKTQEAFETNLKDAAQNAILAEHIQSNKDTLQVSHMKQEQDTEVHRSSDKSHAINGESVKFSDFDTTNNSLCCHSQETEPKTCDDNETGNMDVLAGMDIRDLSNDFSNTFMLDEEIELEHNMLKKTELSSTKRCFIVLYLLISKQN